MHEIQGRLHIDGHALENSGAVQASGTLITTHLWEALSRALQIVNLGFALDIRFRSSAVPSNSIALPGCARYDTTS